MDFQDRVLRTAKRHNILRLVDVPQDPETEERMWEQLPHVEQDELVRQFTHLLGLAFPEHVPSHPGLNIHRVLHLEGRVDQLEAALSEMAEEVLQAEDEKYWIPCAKPPPPDPARPETHLGGKPSAIVLGWFEPLEGESERWVTLCEAVHHEEQIEWYWLDDYSLDKCQRPPTHWHPVPKEPQW